MATGGKETGTTFKEFLKTEEAFGKISYFSNLGNLDSPFSGPLLVDTEDTGTLQSNVPSLINKFTIFQYAPLFAGFKYRPEGHFIGFNSNLKDPNTYIGESNAEYIRQRTLYQKNLDIAKAAGNGSAAEQIAGRIKSLQDSAAGQKEKAKNFVNNQQDIPTNPTAARLVKWGSEKSAGTTIGFQPYSFSDFMFCKYYGKIPNNRLITLRRYPFPVDDSLRISSKNQKRNAIPVAQAVTWFGGETKNTLNGLGLFKWDIPWDQTLDSIVGDLGQEIKGNEITLDELSSLFKSKSIPGGEEIAAALKAAYVAFGSDQNLAQASGYEGKIQQFQKNLYDQTSGPYWNRIFGPVNVIHRSTKRKRGIQETTWTTSFSINFHYSFRSFNGLSPKIVALDLISNFMNLTYQDAQFLNQLARYFPKTGVKFDPTTTEAIGQILTNWGTTFSGNNSEQWSTILSNIHSTLLTMGSKLQGDAIGTGKKVIQTALMNPKLLGGAMPDMVSIRSALSDRPIGEWHLVVGNPINPIFVMGDLICKNAEMAWDEEMGPDDFPTGVTFTVTLAQGKPRDKTAIERMLNHGQTKLTAGMLRTSSSDDTFGDKNNDEWNKLSSEQNTPEKLQDYYSKMTDARKAGYERFKTRFLTGYGFKDSPKGQLIDESQPLDTSLLLMYYQRQYGNN